MPSPVFPPARLELGLGLLSIGRVWGVGRSEPPSEADALLLLAQALEFGIRVFDTAPAYAVSEARLGRFLRGLEPSRRGALLVMTKAGEHWDFESGTSFVDHGRDVLRRSIDRSLELLGRVDVLQIHKATRDVVRDPDVIAAIEHARACGITTFGASVADAEAGLAALSTGLYQALQFPLNRTNLALAPLLAAARESNATAIINRPLAMGGLVIAPEPGADPVADAFRFVRDKVERGIVLTGTAKPAHLAANVAAFRAATTSGMSAATER
jgi:aryl-alcohol dehydrogenase-like predicted oxidoreductase